MIWMSHSCQPPPEPNANVVLTPRPPKGPPPPGLCGPRVVPPPKRRRVVVRRHVSPGESPFAPVVSHTTSEPPGVVPVVVPPAGVDQSQPYTTVMPEAAVVVPEATTAAAVQDTEVAPEAGPGVVPEATAVVPDAVVAPEAGPGVATEATAAVMSEAAAPTVEIQVVLPPVTKPDPGCSAFRVEAKRMPMPTGTGRKLICTAHCTTCKEPKFTIHTAETASGVRYLTFECAKCGTFSC